MQRAVATALGYNESPNFIGAGDLEDRPIQTHSHVYRKARAECGLQGVYVLKAPDRPDEIPVVFYCRAEDEATAALIHRRVWNQGIVPFILVETSKALRLYSGFRCAPHATADRERGVLEAAVAFNDVAARLAAFRADSIDSGAVWDRWAADVDPRSRVDWSLLAELEKLGTELRRQGLDRPHAHALIGKFVYLKYLCDRQILSDRKLAKWGLKERDLFGHTATMAAFWKVNEELEDWLNGSVFPLPRQAIRDEHVRLVANVFLGGTAGGQLPLDLGRYDFSFIPIETLSVIYQQFLHAPEEGRTSRGRETGAYYTPLPLVNYLLGELETRRPLAEGMRVLDPSCGSGAFLVQCYRTLIEKKRVTQDHLRLKELSDLLTKHIFGVDRDGDACQVAEMSLILTLLDYAKPPDLESNPQFKLPTLRDRNIFQADFFEEGTPWAQKRLDFKADWLVGNPPWIEASTKKVEDLHALKWMRENAEQFPTGGKQVAEAFVWHSLPLLNEGAVAGLLLPAMTLFKMESTGFRARLFQTVQAWCVANFANLAYVLFAESEAPTMALFFRPRENGVEGVPPEERILTFAPILANQCVGRPDRPGHRKETWTVVVNGAEMREVRTAAVTNGAFLPWKEAMWGSFRDGKLLGRIARRFPTLADFAKQHGLHVHEGFQLRSADSDEATEPVPELAGRLQVDFAKLKECGRIFAFPDYALSPIPAEKARVRKRGGLKGLDVSRPPHVIVDASRRFAVFSNEFLAVPPRKIGVSGPEAQIDLLKTLSIYLSSAFCTYQQYFTTPEWGVRTSLATMDALMNLPVPLAQLPDRQLHEWARVRDSLVAEFGAHAPPDATLRELDERVYAALGLTGPERILVDDFVRWNMQMIKGKVPAKIVARPADRAIQSYLATLKGELDAFVGNEAGLSHDVCGVRDGASAMVAIRVVKGEAPGPVLLEAGAETAAALARTREHLVRQHSQWLYFERCLKVYQDGAMYVLKPLEMIHWTRRQAILDAGEIVAETLGTQNA